MSVRDALKRLSDSVIDLSNLEVTTYTGKLDQAIDASTGQIKWDEFHPASGKLTLVAATLVRPNLNTVNFRASDVLGADNRVLLELHNAAVDSARNGRMALLRMFTSMLPLHTGG